jgi:hypothetical protein
MLLTAGTKARMATRVELERCPACGSQAAVTYDYAENDAGEVVAGPVPVAVRCPNPECDPVQAVTAAKRLREADDEH